MPPRFHLPPFLGADKMLPRRHAGRQDMPPHITAAGRFLAGHFIFTLSPRRSRHDYHMTRPGAPTYACRLGGRLGRSHVGRKATSALTHQYCQHCRMPHVTTAHYDIEGKLGLIHIIGILLYFSASNDNNTSRRRRDDSLPVMPYRIDDDRELIA